MLRGAAAAIITLWLAALVTCWFHCASGGCTSVGAAKVAKRPSCHGGSSDSKSKTGNSSDCIAQSKFSIEAVSAELNAPAPVILYFSAADFELALSNLNSPVDFRPAHTREWVFTPEVCLGPAFRSHAPPTV
jgi:hypothetical protein